MTSRYMLVGKNKLLRIITPTQRVWEEIRNCFSSVIENKMPARTIAAQVTFTYFITVQSKKTDGKNTAQLSPAPPRKKDVPTYRSALGSLVKIDYEKKIARITAVKDDPGLVYLLIRMNCLTRFLARGILVHGAVVSRKKEVIVLTGCCGVGKSTLSRLLIKERHSGFIVADDCLFLFPREKGPCVISLENLFIATFKLLPFSFHQVSRLCFVIKAFEEPSCIIPISAAEALKRIMFHADIMLNDDDGLVDWRLSILRNFVSRLCSFVLVNGRGLADGPGEVQSLLDEALKERIGRLQRKRY